MSTRWLLRAFKAAPLNTWKPSRPAEAHVCQYSFKKIVLHIRSGSSSTVSFGDELLHPRFLTRHERCEIEEKTDHYRAPGLQTQLEAPDGLTLLRSSQLNPDQLVAFPKN